MFLMSCHLLMQIAGSRCQGDEGLVERRASAYHSCFNTGAAILSDLTLFFVFNSYCAASVFVRVDVCVCLGGGGSQQATLS